MWTFPQTSHSHRIDAQLIMRTPSTRDDVERIAEFNASIHGPELAPTTRSLLYDHPAMEPADQIFVETDGGQIVSALCLIPWTWRCENATLSVGELGIVGTAEAYRGRGLIRTQMDYFRQRFRERRCVISSIQGIPYFYRQFGYEYALPLEGGYRLELRHVPAADDSPYILRQATIDDIGTLEHLYQTANAHYCFSNARSEEVWRYLLTHNDPADAMVHDTWLAIDAGGAACAYMRIPHFHFHEELAIDEAAVNNHAAALALLNHAKALAEARNKPGIRLNLPADSHLVRLAVAYGAYSMGAYAWQIHIPEAAALLHAMTPALDVRLAQSPFHDWSGDLLISFYTSALALSFDGGRLRAITTAKPVADAKVSLPYKAFVPLVLGYRSLDEIRSQRPDAIVEGEAKLLLDTLFPKRASFIYTNY